MSPLSTLCLAHPFFLCCSYECFREENTINVCSMALLLLFSVAVTVVSVALPWRASRHRGGRPVTVASVRFSPAAGHAAEANLSCAVCRFT